MTGICAHEHEGGDKYMEKSCRQTCRLQVQDFRLALAVLMHESACMKWINRDSLQRPLIESDTGGLR